MIQQYYEHMVAATAIISALIAFRSQIKALWTGAYKVGQGVTHFFATYPEDKKKLNDIYHEVKPNGGSSMSDSVRRIEGMVIHGAAREDAKFNMADQAMWETNAKGEVVKVNREFALLVGRSVEDLTGANWKNTIHPDDLSHVANEWEHIVQDGRDSSIQYRIQRPDGHVIPVVARGEVMNPKDQVIGWIGTLEPLPPQAVETPLETKKKPRVLIVEDGSDTRELYRYHLSVHFDVETASSGRDAIQTFSDAQSQGNEFKVIVMDFAMPDMDGMQTLKVIREKETVRNRTKVFFVTGNEHLIDLNDKRDYVVIDVLRKPINPSDVGARIWAALKTMG